ncbi:neurofilament medium polypeptide-like [Anneissia japonica]|uniref:neurofilament medium polypeptide-like n=1 Tax=Anneissia japonica TaxID=1529436 RepID=UPI0014256545|nr:neurofilament medium polypeptide-like [Anneissia japonica]
MFKVGSTVQAIDGECGIWLTGKVKEAGDGKHLIQWAGYGNVSWIEDTFVRLPIRKRTISAAHLALRTLQRGDIFRKTIPGGGLSPTLTVETNDPFLCEIKTAIGIAVRYEFIAEESLGGIDDDDSESDETREEEEIDVVGEAHQGRKKRQKVSVEKPAAKVLDTGKELFAEKVRGEFDFDFVDLEGVDQEIEQMSDDYEQATGKKTPDCTGQWRVTEKTADCCAALAERVRTLEYKNAELSNTVAEQQSKLGRQSEDILSLHQRLVALEQQPPAPRITPQRPIPQQWFQPSTSGIASRPTIRPTTNQPQPPPTPARPPPVALLQLPTATHEPDTTPSRPVGPPQPPTTTHETDTTPSRPVAPPRPRRPLYSEELPREIMMKLLRDQEDTKKVSKHLLAYFFTDEERLRCNVSGTRNADMLDPERMTVVKRLTFHYSPVPKALEEKVWRTCVIAIDAARRNKKRDNLRRLSVEMDRQ